MTNFSSEFCDDCVHCDFCDNCFFCDNCDSCRSCHSCDSCDSCIACTACYGCRYCYYCYTSRGLRLSERMIFCAGDGGEISSGPGFQKINQIFNVQVTTEEWDQARKSLPHMMLDFAGRSYEQAWVRWWDEASDKDRQAITDLPHFDAAIFEQITGITVSNERQP